MDRLGAFGFSDFEYQRMIKIGVSGTECLLADRIKWHCFVGQLRMQGLTIGRRIYGDGANVQPTGGTNDVACYFAAVRNQQGFDHGQFPPLPVDCFWLLVIQGASALSKNACRPP